MTTREEALHHVPLFSTLPESDLRELADSLLPQDLEQGSLMFREGDKGSENHTIADLREKNRQLRKAFDELKAAQAQIVEKERLERELEVARDIQLSILPRELPEDPAWDLGVHFSSMEAVGGDFYDVIELGNGKLGIAVGDVSGHGVPAALFMSLTATMLRAEAKRSDSPGDVLRAINSQLLETSDSGMFVTVLYGILDSSAGTFEYARAGHSTPLLAVPGKPPVQLEDGLGQLLGVFEDMVLDEVTIPLKSDSVMVIYTDGVTESANEGKAFFGEDGLLEAIKSSDEMQPDALLQISIMEQAVRLPWFRSNAGRSASTLRWHRWSAGHMPRSAVGSPPWRRAA